MKLLRYQREDGKVPFSDWLNGLRDRRAQAQIRVRLQRLAAGNLGDIKAVGGGLSELRIHLGPGYRVYLAQHGETWVLLLSGGDKSSQQKDIETARNYLRDWQERQQ